MSKPKLTKSEIFACLKETLTDEYLFESKLIEFRDNLDIDILNELMKQACLSNLFKSASFLLSYGADLNPDKVLLKCCQLGLARIVKFLIIRGASLCEVNSKGQNCGHIAYLSGHQTLGNWLIYKTNIKLCVKDKEGRTVLDCRNYCKAKYDASNESYQAKENFDTAFILNKSEEMPCGSALKGIKWLKKARHE